MSKKEEYYMDFMGFNFTRDELGMIYQYAAPWGKPTKEETLAGLEERDKSIRRRIADAEKRSRAGKTSTERGRSSRKEQDR